MTFLVNVYVSMLGKLPVLVLILLAAAAVILGDYSAKEWSVTHRGVFLLLAFAGYFFSGFFYIPTLLREGLIITSIIWGLLSTLGFLVIGLVIFNEALTIPQIIAVVLGTIALFVLTVF